MATYDDGVIRCDDQGLTIRRYYLWGAKRIRYAAIEDVQRIPLAVHRWRIWGSGDFVHWWNLDRRRPGKDTALVLHLAGKRVLPTITPDDPDAVERILAGRGGGGRVA
ncbi:MAG TPA: hypothetical protein VFN97_03120 [Actinospica sp.]|nr:hypothetical protein [Actinospica sp.]